MQAGELCKYTFDRVFGMDSAQEEVYESIGDVALTSLRQGFNSTILAYGQTGSGKTYSMEVCKGLLSTHKGKCQRKDSETRKRDVLIVFINVAESCPTSSVS